MPHHTPSVPARDNSTKLCSKCKQSKPTSQFAKDPARNDGVSSQCKECRAQWSRDNAPRLREKAREWQKNNRERAIATVRAWEQNNPEKINEYVERYSEQKRARDAVHYAVRKGDFPPAWAMVCEDCHEAQAAHWHHHKGYSGEHKTDVIALCTECHGKEHRAQ